MPIPAYQMGYPPDGSSLGQTKTTIRNNLDGTFQTLNVDHVNNNGQPGSKPAGYHTIIHQVPQTVVNTVSGYNQVFSGVPGTLVVNSTTTPAIPNNSDQQLYSLTGDGTLAQLTGYVLSGSGTNMSGYAWMGGILVQWGVAQFSGSDVDLTFNFSTGGINFPTACFQVFAIMAGQQTPVSVDTFNQTSCSVVRGSDSLNDATVRYIAIGN